jgi:hypothetical protein
MGNTGALYRHVYMQVTGGMASRQVRVFLSVPGDTLNDNGRVY